MTTWENISENFKTTMSDLEKGLQVKLITTPTKQLCCCEDNEDLAVVLARPDLQPFDQIPVTKQGAIVGLLKKCECQNAKGFVRDRMLPLGEDILVSADMPLLQFIQSESLDRIVIDSTKIYGLVTRSDLFKLPVLLLGFALVTHVERLMLDMIHSVCGNKEEDLLDALPAEIRGSIDKIFKERKKEHVELPKLELTYFSDKRKILNWLCGEKEYASQLPCELVGYLPEIQKLRNTVAHTGTPDDDDTLEKFIDRLRRAHTWIDDAHKWVEHVKEQQKANII